MSEERRTVDDLDRAIRSVASHFGQDTVVIVGSQAALVGWPAAPDGMRRTPEIDIYLGRGHLWERDNQGLEVSEEIAGLFGYRSEFHSTFGFYIDGVSPNTAPLPKGWQERALYREVKVGDVTITAIAPSLEDLVVSKMRRLEKKDREYIEACHEVRPLDLNLLRERIQSAPFHEFQREAANRYLAALPIRPSRSPSPLMVEIPPHPEGTHKAFVKDNGLGVLIRELDEESGLYVKLGNTLGPAAVTPSAKGFAISGKRMSEEAWEKHPDVIAASVGPHGIKR